jgi:putative ABC transport system permease protein
VATIVRQVRSLFRQRTLVISAVLVLALGMGTNTAMFSVLDQILLRALPYPQSDRLISIYASSPLQGLNKGVASVADFLDLRDQTRSFSDLAAYAGFRCNLLPTETVDTSEQVLCAYATANFFTALRQPAIEGRPFVTGDDEPAHPAVAVLSERLWKRRYAADQKVIGQVLHVSGKPYLIAGIMPSTFRFPQNDTELWVVITLTTPKDRDPFYLRIIGRLRPGISLESARSELATFASTLEARYPKWYSDLNFPLMRLQDSLVGDLRLTLLVLQGLVFLVLLIAQINIAGLLLVRAFKREREIAIQLCLGARPRHLMQQLAVESIVLSLLGGVLGLVFAAFCLFYLRRFGPQNIAGLQRVALDGTAVLFTFLSSLVTCGLIGILPALQGLSPALSNALRGTGSRESTMSRSKRFLRESLLVGEMTMCFVLVVVVGMLLETLSRMEKVDLGFQTPPEQVLTMQVFPSGPYIPEQRIVFYKELLQRIDSLPGVRSAAISASLPPDRTTFTTTFEIEGKQYPLGQHSPSVTVPTCSPDYFKTLGIPLLRGRIFSDEDRLNTPKVAIISDRLAKQYFAGQDPIGKRLRDAESEGSEKPYMEIVGVVGDVKYTGITSEFQPVFYNTASQEVSLFWNYLVVKADHPENLIDAIRQQVRAIDPTVTVSRFSRMDQSLADSLAIPRLRAFLMTVFAILAILLTMVGIYSVISYHVSERKREIGIYVAFGASHKEMLGRLLWRSLRLGLISILLGACISFACSRLYHAFLFGIHDNDISALVVTSFVLLGATLIATYLAARSVVRLQPSEVLRSE